ncbi:hypothetical protein BWI17_15195 [Betaproteobacteria bacterium GR16-43]|nr:hypothetical protein BWI17_15195 [Betaproteobacteria bacterium GR16-43]
MTMRLATLAFLAVLLASCAAPTSSVPPAVRSELAPTGKLRVGVVGSTSKGVGVDIGRELGQRLGVPVEFVRYESASALWVGVTKGEWDVASLGIDAQRANEMNFTAAYLYLGDVPVALAVPRGRTAAYPYTYEFVEDLKSSGFVGEAIARDTLPGARVAPARAK